MKNWIEINSTLNNQIWQSIYNNFNFKPSIHKEDWPSFTLPGPFIVYDIAHLFGEDFEYLYLDLENCILNAMIACSEENEYLYALDWQHESYLFNPRFESPINEFNEWPIPLYPNGDYYFFIKKDFSWGYLGHPWEKSISVFGEELIRAIETNKPKLFTKAIRKNI
ncbi:DUF2716 domain-containing protein [Paenibacillus assamensis]|uniref:DUF2716 domain-containing protein n=1 Tax=Paenibacillus assamensis TaxID=311244 RepID=UPI0004910E77|nr:DUF2716 domain-containing protein [Paenibacillus assamensis]